MPTPDERKAAELDKVIEKREAAAKAADDKRQREERTKRTGDKLAEFHKNNPRWKPGKSR